MLFDLDGSEGQWFPFFGSRVDPKTGDVIYEEPATDGRVKIRSLVPYLEGIVSKRKRTVEHVYNPKTRSMDRVAYTAEPTPEQAQIERDDAWDYAIVAFEHLKDKRTGAVIECTRENKLKLMRVPAFDRFFSRCQELLADLAVSQEADAQKNS